MYNINELHIQSKKKIITPKELKNKFPITKKIINHIILSREKNKSILIGKDKRLLVIIGPCSIHDIKSTIEYAKILAKLRLIYKDYLEIIMRTYFEKPRTILGWNGLILDPNLNNSFEINKGLKLAREILITINGLGLPTATEFLNIIISQYIFDLISFGTIGARTTESQIHRQMASSLYCPIGFKNSTNGDFKIAINAILTSKNKNIHLSLDDNGKINFYHTRGNPDCYIIMRGGKKPNYFKKNIISVCKQLKKFNLPEQLIIDFSHGNCQKKYKKQIKIAKNIAKQLKNGSKSIVGVMIESFLLEGRQKLVNKKKLKYGQSITDPCLNWKDTEKILSILAEAVQFRF